MNTGNFLFSRMCAMRPLPDLGLAGFGPHSDRSDCFLRMIHTVRIQRTRRTPKTLSQAIWISRARILIVMLRCSHWVSFVAGSRIHQTSVSCVLDSTCGPMWTCWMKFSRCFGRTWARAREVPKNGLLGIASPRPFGRAPRRLVLSKMRNLSRQRLTFRPIARDFRRRLSA